MPDDRDFIERSNSLTKQLYGAPMSPERIVDNFALYGLQKRAAALESFDRELLGETDSSPNGLRKRAQLIGLRRQLGRVHEALRNAGR
jgi:hypothetical protein